MKKTEVIIFSKNRALQLKSLLVSLLNNSDINQTEINILYKHDPGFEYDSVIKEFKCNFIPQRNFYKDVFYLIKKTEASFILFMVDDLIFRDFFNMGEIELFLEEHRDIDVFSLRLGNHIVGGTSPEFEIINEKFLTWATSKKLGNIWNYFWEVSGSIYRKDLVLTYLNKSYEKNITFPNPLEEYYYDCMPHYRDKTWRRFIKYCLLELKCVFCSKISILFFLNSISTYFLKRKNKMACFVKSKCFTQGINMVAERGIPYKELHSPAKLQEMLEDGYVIDYRHLKELIIEHPNAGNKNVKFVKSKDLPLSNVHQ